MIQSRKAARNPGCGHGYLPEVPAQIGTVVVEVVGVEVDVEVEVGVDVNVDGVVVSGVPPPDIPHPVAGITPLVE